MKKEAAVAFRAFLLELVLYGALVVTYFFFVLHFLGAWLLALEKGHLYAYAAVALLLIIGQAVALEAVTTLLLRLIRGRSK